MDTVVPFPGVLSRMMDPFISSTSFLEMVNPKPVDWKIFDDYGKLMAAKGYAAVIFNHRSSKNTNPPPPDARNSRWHLLQM